MATRAIVAMQLKDGNFLSIYHHWDGYPDHLGKVLFDHYKTYGDVYNYISGGDISSTEDDGTPNYYKDMGEDPERVAPVTSRVEAEVFRRARECCDYIYLFKDGIWQTGKSFT